MIIKFKNWEKNQPRKDIKKPWYFILQNEFFLDSKIYDLDSEEKLTLVYLLCEASRANKSGEFYLSREHYRVHSRMPDRVLNRTIKKLQQLQILNQPRVRGMYVSCEASVQQNRIEENRGEENREYTPESGDSVSEHFLVKIWNNNAGALPKCSKLSKERKKHADLRFKEREDPLYWEEVVKRIASSDFCNGKSTSNWRADFDWFIRPDTHIRVMEGKYDNLEGKKAPERDWRELVKERAVK